MKKNLSLNRIPAFTLIEVMVTIGVLVILLTMSTISYKSANSRSTIIMAAYQVAGDARLAQSYAASARQYLNDPTANVWGIFFNKQTPDKYLIFVDTNANGIYDSENSPKPDAIWKTIALPRGIIVKNIKVANTNPSPDFISPVYFPPTPTTSIAVYEGMPAVLTQKESTTITLEDNQNYSIKEVTFNFFGLIDVTK